MERLERKAFRRMYVCDACGTECWFTVTNCHGSLPKPKCCPYNFPGMPEYNEDVVPNWRELAEDEDGAVREP